MEYCRRHIRNHGSRLYRIFYYDCPPSDKVIYHPLTKQQVNLAKSDDYKWMHSFHRELTKKRKLALRMGENLETQDGFQLKSKPLKELLSGKLELAHLTEREISI